jgi:hypothetical protein
LDGLGDCEVAAFVKRSPGAGATHVQYERAALQLLRQYLRAQSVVPPAPINASPAEPFLKGYLDYLRQDRGLAENSLRVYEPLIRDFLASQMAGGSTLCPGSFDALTIRRYLLTRSTHRSADYSRLLATALRSFCHFLFLRGDTPVDLAISVPMVRTWRQSSLPALLSPRRGGTGDRRDPSHDISWAPRPRSPALAGPTGFACGRDRVARTRGSPLAVRRDRRPRQGWKGGTVAAGCPTMGRASRIRR